MNKSERDGRRERLIREVFHEVCGNKGKVQRIIMEPPGVGEECIESFTILIEYSGDEEFVCGKHDEIYEAILKELFWPDSKRFLFEDADDGGPLNFVLCYAG